MKTFALPMVCALGFLTQSFYSASVLADELAPAVIDVTCKSAGRSEVIQIISNPDGTEIRLNGKTIHSSPDQLIAGTEGGPPYLQVVGGGYNIMIRGGDFEPTFLSRCEIAFGSAPAGIGNYVTNEHFSAICRGLYSFRGANSGSSLEANP